MHTPREVRLDAGATINGKYRLLKEIGAGGMGKIFMAEQIPLGRTVAVKVVHAHLGGAGSQPSGTDAGAESFQRRFFREASALSQLRHRNIVTVFDYGRVDPDGALFMVMECLDGEPLSAQLRGGRRLDEMAVLELLQQVGRGLREVHQQGMVHRDLKPPNIFLAREGGETVCKVLDFGLVKQVKQAGDPDELTEAGALLGSPTYMSPEQVMSGEIDQRTDLYALGAVLYHCLTGKPPFEGSLTQVMVQHTHQPAPSFAQRCPDLAISPILERVVMRCLEKDPARRYQSVDELFADLREFEVQAGAVPSSRASGALQAHRLASGSYSPAVREPPPEPADLGVPTAIVPPPAPRASSSVSPASLAGVAPAVPPSSRGLDESGSLASLAAGGEVATRVDLPAPGKKKAPGALLALGAAAVLGVGVWLLARPAASDAPGREVVSAASAVAAASSAAPAVSVAAAMMLLSSVPPGAQVLDGDRVLGVTPLDIPLTDDAERTLVLRLEGHEPFTLRQGARETTRVVIPLKALPKNGKTPGRAGKTANPTGATEPPPTPPPTPAIRLTR